MGNEKPVRRLTLRELLNHAEKYTSNLIENCKVHYLQQVSEIRGLTRPIRRRSQFPTMNAVQNSLRKFKKASDDLNALANFLQEHLEAIRDHATRERVNRL